MSKSHRARGLAAAGLLFLAFGCGNGEEVETGGLGQFCNPDGSCDAPHRCINDVCVEVLPGAGELGGVCLPGDLCDEPWVCKERTCQEPDELICSPNELTSCECSPGEEGLSLCAADGMSHTTCECHAPGDCTSTSLSASGSIRTSETNIALTGAVVEAEAGHRVGTHELDPGCVSSLRLVVHRLEGGTESGCRLTVNFGPVISAGPYSFGGIESVELLADELCPGFTARTRGIYRRGGSSPKSWIPVWYRGPTLLRQAMADTACVGEIRVEFPDQDFVMERDDGRRIEVNLRHLLLSGQLFSRGEAGATCVLATCGEGHQDGGDGWCSPEASCSLGHLRDDEGGCALGCSTGDCGGGQYCDFESGRCVDLCWSDEDCSVPESVCGAAGLCEAGCLDTGCGFEEHCDTETGRCAPGCVEQTDCSPPSAVCGQAGACVEGCMIAGSCPGGLLCDPAIGICEAAGPGALGDPCQGGPGGFDHGLCSTDFCLSLDHDPPVCSRACTSTRAHCPEPGAACHVSFSVNGAGACLDLGAGGGAPGASCSAPSDCKSRQCLGSQCTDTCQHDRDCTLGGHICRLTTGLGRSRLLCGLPIGSGATGAICTLDSACRSGICAGSRCVAPCHTSLDCPADMTCDFLRKGSGEDAAVVRICRGDAGGRTPGTSPVGAECDAATPESCRSLRCHHYGDEDRRCIDVCASQSDCPLGHRCAVTTLHFADGTRGLTSFCVLR